MRSLKLEITWIEDLGEVEGLDMRGSCNRVLAQKPFLQHASMV